MSFIENKRRVREIYGIAENDKRYSIHHICFRSDFKGAERKNMHNKENLIPLKKEDHRLLHQRIQELENEIKATKKIKRKKR